LESLSLSVRRVVNYHLLSNLRYVEFNECESITDVSCFRNSEAVTFTGCHNVTNVNSLKNVNKLVLKKCDGVTDISALGRVKVVKIDDCKNLHDLSGLSTVHNLTVSRCSANCLSSLKQNSVLSISGFFTSLSSVDFLAANNLLRVLDISDNASIRDISMLYTVEVLNITGCHWIKSLTGLTALKELEMIGVEGIESGFEVFEQLTRLEIGEVTNKTHFVQALVKAVFLSTLILHHVTGSFK
jgi:hypothetical protein